MADAIVTTPEGDRFPVEYKTVSLKRRNRMSNKTLADALANEFIRDKADEIMCEAENENDLTHRLAWLVREQAAIVEGLGSEVAGLRLGPAVPTLREQFAIHAPRMPNDWKPDPALLPPKPEKPEGAGHGDPDMALYHQAHEQWRRESLALRPVLWAWHYADLCLSNRGGA